MKLHLPVTTPGYPEPDLAEDESERLLAVERRQQAQKLMQRELEFEAGLIEERTERIQAIENDIIDVNKIMRDLSAMVQQQGEVVGKRNPDNFENQRLKHFVLNWLNLFSGSIEDGIENVHGNVELGRQELDKAAGYQVRLIISIY